MNKLNGYKTYITVGVGIALGVAQALGYPIPVWVDGIVAFMGIGFQRMAIQNQSYQTTQDIAALVRVILATKEDK